MSIADKIRQLALTKYIYPAREAHACPVAVTSGDIANVLQLSGRYPAICAALGANEFTSGNRLRRLNVDGPLNGASTRFFFCWCGNHSVVIQFSID